MIYRALVELAEREDLLRDSSYEPKEVDFLVVLGGGGELIDVLAPRDPSPLDAKGRPKGRPRAPRRAIPRRSDRTSGDEAEFLVDKAEYVFGIDPQGRRAPDRLMRRRQLFRRRVEEAAATLPGSRGLKAVVRFLEQELPQKIRHLLQAESAADRPALSGALFAFVYKPDGAAQCVHDEPAVKHYFRRLLENEEDVPRGQCLVTGETDVPLTRLHAKPRGIPPRADTGGGVPLTSTNAAAFQSYGLDGIGGAPISRTANVAIETALNRLLDPAYPGPTGEPLPVRNVQVSRDTVFVYWARGETALDFLRGLEERDPEEVGWMLRSPCASGTVPLEDPTDFYALMLSGATGRAILRSFLHSTVREVAQAIEKYRSEASIIRPYQQGPGGYALREIRAALAPLGDIDRLPPSLGTHLYLDILYGRSFPRSVLDAGIRRSRAHDFHDNRAQRDFRRLAPRCSLLKAYFNRNHGEGVNVSLDTQRTDAPYLLGRLLATIDKVQQEALGSVNVTVVDRYYGGASSTPGAVFPTLLRRSQNHLAKLRRDKGGLAVHRDRLLQEILGAMQGFPSTMNLEAQGLFALGFYHQRQDFFTKKEA